MTFSYFSPLFLPEKHKPLRKQAHGDGRENIRHGMLLDEGHRNTDHTTPDGNGDPKPLGGAFLPQPCGGNTQTISHMQRGQNAGIGVKGIDGAQDPGQHILPGKHLRPQILPVGIEDIHRHGNDLGDDDIGLQLFEAVHIVQQEVHHGPYDQQIPAYIGDHKPFAERHRIIQGDVNGMAFFRRDQILRQKIQDKITHPAQQQQQMPVFWGADVG